jgi:hypothetical protein
MIHILSPAYLTYPILIPSLITQKSGNWRLKIAHDSENEQFTKWVGSFRDPRVTGLATDKRLGAWGHPIRRILLEQLQADDEDMVIISNHDNYYCPDLIAQLEATTESFVTWSILHNYYGYSVLSPKIEIGNIDVGQVAVKVRIAKQVGWYWTDNCSDFKYVSACWQLAKTYKFLNSVLGVHN